MSEEEPKSPEELQRELTFYRNQTKVLREKNRDLRNALLLVETKEVSSLDQETAQDSLSDIRKIIADSKKQITEKLTQFKDTLKETGSSQNDTKTLDPNEGGPLAPNYSLTTESSSEKEESKSDSLNSSTISTDAEILVRQVEYLKEENERLENFLEQSEMVNNRLRDLLTEHSIDVSEISESINEVSKTAISQKKDIDLVTSVNQPVVQPTASEHIVEEKIEEPKETIKQKDLDPAVAKLFDEFIIAIDNNSNVEEIKLGILDLREKLMELIPHSRVFYEMQVEYRKWNRGEGNVPELKAVIEEWKNTISMI